MSPIPIKRKIMTVIMLTSIAVLLVSIAAFMVYDLVAFRHTMARNLETQGQIIAQNCTAALAFKSEKDAGEILSSLRAEPRIAAAALYDAQGNLFIKYPAEIPDSDLPTAPENRRSKFGKSELTLFQPVIQSGKRLGTLYLRSDLTAISDRLKLYGMISLIIAIGALLIAFWLSNTLQKRISDPIVALAATARNISEKHDYSVRASKTSDDELGYLTEAFNSMLDQIHTNQRELEHARDEAVKASRAKDDFLAALSHELRTPLTPVLLLASDAAADGELPGGVRANFETIRKNVELEARLIDDLLDLTRITSNKLSLDLRTTDVHAALQNAIETVQPEIRQKRIILTLDLQAERHAMMGDEVRLQQIFWNVLKNAVKFTPEAGKISIETRNENGRLAVKITDTGIGMTPPELQRIFNAFAQGDHALGVGSHRFGGLGLGLAISQKLATLHSGVICAASDGRDRGAVFTIELPALDTTQYAKYLDHPNSSAVLSGAPARGNRILLVEDHEPTRTALEQLLTRRHYEVKSAATVAEALELAVKMKVDLLISDIGLPDGDGYSLMAQLQKLYGIKGIALTGYGMEDDIARSQEAGFITHLTKPVYVRTLENALAAASAAPAQKS